MTILKFAFYALGTILLFSACEKDEIPVFTGSLCNNLTTENPISAKSSIDNFLQSLPGKNSDKDLESLAQWLLRQECVKQIDILCNSCIFSLPPQSELRLTIGEPNQVFELHLAILMSEPMEVMRVD